MDFNEIIHSLVKFAGIAYLIAMCLVFSAWILRIKLRLPFSIKALLFRHRKEKLFSRVGGSKYGSSRSSRENKVSVIDETYDSSLTDVYDLDSETIVSVEEVTQQTKKPINFFSPGIIKQVRKLN